MIAIGYHSLICLNEKEAVPWRMHTTAWGTPFVPNVFQLFYSRFCYAEKIIHEKT
jgi:hypothetical protein